MLPLVLYLTIVLNEVMPAPASGPEWVELYNPTDNPVDVSGWKIDDDTPGGSQTTIAAGSSVPAHGFLVVPLSSAILNNTGDSATLVDASGVTIDAVAFGALKSTESLARTPDGGTIWGKSVPSQGSSNGGTDGGALATPTAMPTATAAPALPATETPPLSADLSATPVPLLPTETSVPTAPPLPSATPIPPATQTPTESRTPSSTKTPSPTRTPSDTRTASLTKSPSVTRTPSNTKTPSTTRTSSITKTRSTTKTPSRTKTPSLTKTASRTRSTTRSKTPSKTKTPSRTRTATRTHRTTQTARDKRAGQRTQTSRSATRAVQRTAFSPTLQPTAHQAAPSPALQLIAVHTASPAPFSPTPSETARTDPDTSTALAVATPEQPVAAEWPLVPLGCVLLMMGWIGLRVFARVAAPVLYSEADGEAETRATGPAQRVEGGESSTRDGTDGTAESATIEKK